MLLILTIKKAPLLVGPHQMFNEVLVRENMEDLFKKAAMVSSSAQPVG